MSSGLRYSMLSFDLDGTLVDTAGEIAEAANRTIEEFGWARRPVDSITRLIGVGTRELMLALLREVGEQAQAAPAAIDRDAVLRRFSFHYEATAGTACRAYPGALDAVARLRAAGLRLACVTNKEERFSVQVLARCGLSASFDLLISGDSLAFKKPDARVLGEAIARLGASRERSAHVGDSRIDVEAARNAGVAAWVVPYGYNGGAAIADARPDRVFADLREVAAFVLD